MGIRRWLPAVRTVRSIPASSQRWTVLTEIPNSKAASFGESKRLFFISQVYGHLDGLSRIFERRCMQASGIPQRHDHEQCKILAEIAPRRWYFPSTFERFLPEPSNISLNYRTDQLQSSRKDLQGRCSKQLEKLVVKKSREIVGLALLEIRLNQAMHMLYTFH